MDVDESQVMEDAQTTALGVGPPIRLTELDARALAGAAPVTPKRACTSREPRLSHHVDGVRMDLAAPSTKVRDSPGGVDGDSPTLQRDSQILQGASRILQGDSPILPAVSSTHGQLGGS